MNHGAFIEPASSGNDNGTLRFRGSIGLLVLLLIRAGMSCGGQSVNIRVFDAIDFDQNKLTIGDADTADLQSEEVILRGKLVRTSGTLRWLLKLVHEIEMGYGSRCLSLLMRGGAAGFPDEGFSMSFDFLGRFVLLDNVDDPEAVYFTCKGISFTPNCQSNGHSRQSAYFLVSAFRESGTSTFVNLE